MSFFTFDIKKVIIALALVAVPLVSINMQRNPENDIWIAKPFSLITDVVQNAYYSFSSGIRGTTSDYLDLIDIKKNNRLLLKKNSEYRAQLGALTELKLENVRLNSLIAFKQKSNMELLAAKVIGKDLVPDHATIKINRGTKHGIKKNQAAITVGGVVGYVIQPDIYSSQILLLTDRYAAIDAIVQRSRARGIIEGRGKNSCKLSYLQREDDVVKGDLVVTSGLDNIFPKGFPVGTVSNVEKSRYGMNQHVEITPSINPFTLEEIFIVLNANQENFDSEQESVEDNQSPEQVKANNEITKETTKQQETL